MHELVLLLSDLYLAQDTPDAGEIPLPGLQQIVRFGARSRIDGDWRAWLARSFGSLPEPAATTAARAVTDALEAPGTSAGHHAWIATPVHMLAGLTTLHLDRRGILRLASNEAYALAADFARTFSDSPFRLIALPSGDFLLRGPASGGEQAFEPARLVGGGVAEAQPLMARRAALRSLGAEIEMWLHEHSLNQARRQRGEPPVTGLWFWGGGPWPTTMAAAAINAASVVTYGRDAVLEGLASISKHTSAAVPAELHDLFGEPSEARTVLVLEIGALMFANARWTLREAVTNIDARYLAPAVGFLRQRKLRTMHLLANDYHFLLRPGDLLKFWHRSQPGLTGLT